MDYHQTFIDDKSNSVEGILHVPITDIVADLALFFDKHQMMGTLANG